MLVCLKGWAIVSLTLYLNPVCDSSIEQLWRCVRKTFLHNYCYETILSAQWLQLFQRSETEREPSSSVHNGYHTLEVQDPRLGLTAPTGKPHAAWPPRPCSQCTQSGCEGIKSRQGGRLTAHVELWLVRDKHCLLPAVPTAVTVLLSKVRLGRQLFAEDTWWLLYVFWPKAGDS